MNFLFLINVIFSFAISFIIALGFFRFHKDKFLSKIIYYVSPITFFYLLIALSSFLWFFSFFEFSPGDFLILYSIIIFLQSLLFLKVISLISRNRKLFYFLLFYAIPFISFFYSGAIFFNSLIVISLLLCFLFFIDLTFRSDLYDKLGYLGMFYSLLGIIFQVFSLFFPDKLFLFSIFSEALLFIFFYLFLRDLSINPPVAERKLVFKKKPYLFSVLGHMVFIIVLANLIFVGTIALHEFGHFSVAKLLGCEAGKIVYENGYFHTEVLCKDDSKTIYVLLGGILIPFIFAVILFFSGARFMRDISILIAGFNLLSISRDFSELGFSKNLILISIFFGILILLLGVIILSKSKVEGDIYLSPVYS